MNIFTEASGSLVSASIIKTLKNIGFSNVTLRKCFDRGLSPDDTDEVVV